MEVHETIVGANFVRDEMLGVNEHRLEERPLVLAGFGQDIAEILERNFNKNVKKSHAISLTIFRLQCRDAEPLS